MRARGPRLGLVAALVLIDLLARPGLPVAAADPTFVIGAPGHLFGQPRTDGVYLAWFDKYNPGSAVRLYLYHLAERRLLPATGGQDISYEFDLGGGVAVWAGSLGASDIWAIDMATGRRFTVVATDARETAPVIAGRWVYWRQDGPGHERAVMRRDIKTMAPPVQVVPPRELGTEGMQFVANERYIVVSTSRFVARSNVGSIRALRIEDGRWMPVTSFSMYVPWFTLGGDLVVVGGFPTGGQLTLFNLATGAEQVIARDELPDRRVGRATTDGRYVIWPVYHGEDPSRAARVDLVGYDAVTDTRFPLLVDAGSNDAPWLGGGMLVWKRGAAPQQTLHAARLEDLRAAAPVDDPTIAETVFAETGRALRDPFKRFWEANGGLPVFGLPLTDQFAEQAPDADRATLVQYVERQRLEYAPDLVGTPYEVLLGRLGAEAAARRGDLTGFWAFNPIPPDAAHPPGCRYLPDARHRLCGEFRPHWEGHGLDLGDEGTSFRESLALFGYPISEEFIDRFTGLITQYFERAVFEYHPDLPPGQRVLLRRLGAERICDRRPPSMPGCAL